MNKLKLIAAACLFFSIGISDLYSQKEELNPLKYGVPSLTIAPDARGGGMGDLGAATEPDFASQYWNPAKYAFAYSKAGVGLSYTPWLRKLVDDIDLAYLSGYYKLGDSDLQALGVSLRYFSLGKIDLTDYAGTPLTQTKPYEMAIDVSYSRKLSETFSGGVAFRYIYSDLGTGAKEIEMKPGSVFAADIAGYYNNYVMLGSSECLLGLGFNISNIAAQKISYDDDLSSTFVPTTLRLGGSLLYPLDDYNTLSVNMDISKYLIPTYPNLTDLSNEEMEEEIRKYQDISPISGIFKSFGDAPGGAKEEFNEIMWSFGAEYSYNQQFFVRGGYFYEHPTKGNRQYFSMGAGFKMNVLQIDAAYLISTVPSNPLDQTLRFSLSFDMDGLKSLMR